MRALSVSALLLFVTVSPASAQQDSVSRITAVEPTATDRFTDVSAKGKPEGEFKDKFVRFVTPDHPEGFVARVKSFDPITGEFTLYTEIPAGIIRQKDFSSRPKLWGMPLEPTPEIGWARDAYRDRGALSNNSEEASWAGLLAVWRGVWPAITRFSAASLLYSRS